MPMTLPANAVSANTRAALTPPTSQIPRDDFWQLETRVDTLLSMKHRQWL